MAFTNQFPEPASSPDLRGLLLDYLDFFRSVVVAKLDGLTPGQVADSVVPSGWTPAGLVNHLANVERRWLQWGFMAEPVGDPWRDAAPDGGWVSPSASADELKALLTQTAVRTRAIVEAHELAEIAEVGGRFDGSAPPPQLQWILLHVLQEYARHVGHLDIARELMDGHTGEEG